MRYKPDWSEARERWCALWEGRMIDRPCVTVTAPKCEPRAIEPPASLEARWLDADYVVRKALAVIESTHWGGEALPGDLLMGGWVSLTGGATPRFLEGTIWFEHIEIDWDDPPRFELDWGDPWLVKYTRLREAALAAAGREDFVVGQACALPGNDVLATLMEPALFFTSLVDRPGWMRQSILKLARNRVALLRHFRERTARVHDFVDCATGWMPWWAPKPMVSMQSDVSCMVSSEMFDEFIVPELDLHGAEFGSVWYHLDGSQARHHLGRLCSLPYVRFIQYTPEPGTPPNGPAYLDMYRRIQAAGKVVHVRCPPENVEPLVSALDPGLVCLQTRVRSVCEADELLESTRAWVRRRSVGAAPAAAGR